MPGRRRLPTLFRAVIDVSRRDWSGYSPAERARLARWAVIGVAISIAGTNFVIGVETFLLVQLAFNGSQLTFASTVGSPNFPAIVTAVVVGVVVNVVLGLAMLRSQLDWFVSGRPADHTRRREVQRIPLRQVIATLISWMAAVIAYVVVANQLTSTTALGVTVAFALAAVSSSCLTYVFAERAARPLTVVALHDNPARHVTNGVKARMVAVWLVSSAIPMAGLLIINLGRRLDMLPPVYSRIDWATVVLVLVGLASGARVIALVGTAIADPLTDLRRAVERVDHGDLSARVAVYDSSELGVLQHGFNNMVAGLDERDRMRELFARHVGDTVAELAMRRGAGMHGTNAIVGVLFVDIVGSTTIAAQRDPKETVELLNGFFTVVADVVDSHAGFVNKFEGDAALAVFGVPVAIDDPAAAALAAARDLAAGLADLPIKWGIGVSYGMSFAGNVGAEQRYEYTVIGDPVNECARLSELAKAAPVPVLASGTAIAAAGDEAQYWQTVGHRTLRGRNIPTEVFVPVDIEPQRGDPTTVVDVVAGLLRPARDGVADLLRIPFQR